MAGQLLWCFSVLQGVLDSYPGDELWAYPVSKRVNDPENEEPQVVVEVWSVAYGSR